MLTILNFLADVCANKIIISEINWKLDLRAFLSGLKIAFFQYKASKL